MGDIAVAVALGQTMTRHYLLTVPLLAPLAIALVLPACNDDQLEAVVKALGEGCLIDSDCEDDLVCVFRRCHHECETDKDCVTLGVGPYCRLGDRPTNVCLLEDEVGCTQSSDCPTADMACGYGICRDKCDDAGECLPGQSCEKGGCTNVEEEGLSPDDPLLDPAVKGEEGETCIYNSQCLSPLACIQGICRVECIDDRDCPSNATCVVIPECTTSETPAEDDCAEIPDAAACVVTLTPSTPTGPGPAHCSDGVTSGDETGTDCGGSCVPCPSGGGCSDGADCTSGVCASGTCQAPTCNDGVRNGTELGVDCGGACPNGCPTGTTCASSGDCTAPDTCDTALGICVAPECSDGLKNNGESDVDCGGPNCGACDALKDCLTAGDCTSLVCAAGTCLTAGCSDGVKNGLEADVDCGGTGSGCAACGNGAMCSSASDCASGSCSGGGLCVAANCSDGIQNGLELGVDCGGPGCSAGCALGTPCNVDSDCDQTSPAGCHPTNLSCTALRTVTVSLTGFGSGSVSSTPAGINCGADCDTTVFDGASIQLDATTGPNSTFGGFGGDCSGASPCVLAVSGADANVTASFDAGGPGTANWHVLPASIDIEAANPDSTGHLFVTGAGGDWGCGLLTGSGDFAIAKYVPGPAQIEDACVASLIDGGPNQQAPVDLVVDANDDVVVLFTANTSFTLTGHPTEACANSQGLGLAWYDGALGQIASLGSSCYGPALVAGSQVDGGMKRLPNGNLLVAGQITSTTTDLGGPTTVSSANGRFFLTTYDGTTGNHVATRQFVTSSSEILNDVTVHPTTGDIVVTMSCVGSVDFGSGVVSFDAGNGSYDICAVKFDASLVPQWAFQVGSSSVNERGKASAFLPNGDVIVTGYFSTLIHFGDGIFHNAVGDYDIAVILVDGATGTLKSTVPNSSWRAYGTTGQEEISHIEVVHSGPDAGSFYLVGGTRVTTGIDVGGGLLTPGTTLFLAKYSSFGVHEWSVSTDNITVSPWNRVMDLTLTNDGSPLLVGTGGAATDWGSGVLTPRYIARINP